MDARDIFYFSLGAVIGIAAYILYQANHAPKNFNECFLAESKGRQEKAFQIVANLCRERFPRQN